MGDMPLHSKHLAAALASVAAAASMTACSATPAPPSASDAPPPVSAPDTAAPSGAPTGQGTTSEPFDGEVTTETITANQMQVTVPQGIRLPENALVTQSDQTVVMMADEDETAVVEAVTSSARAAGYTVHAETEQGTVLVGNGNAVLFTAVPGMQMLTWGPESMKDALAGTA